jgi:hypothetical protein
MRLLTNFKDQSGSIDFLRVISHPTLLSTINNDSDLYNHPFPVLKLLNPGVSKGLLVDGIKFKNLSFLDNQGTSLNYQSSLSLLNASPKVFAPNGPNAKVLLTDQSVRQYTKLRPFTAHLNLSDSSNTVVSNFYLSNRFNPSPSLSDNYLFSNTGYVDKNTLNHLLPTNYYIGETHPSVLSNNPYIANLDHTNMLQNFLTVNSEKNSVTLTLDQEKLNSVDLLGGPREKAPLSINSDY